MLNNAELDQILKQSLADHYIQASEEQSLIGWVSRNAPDDSPRALARSRAFVIARQDAAGRREVVLN
jgi:hypothetical protein